MLMKLMLFNDHLKSFCLNCPENTFTCISPAWGVSTIDALPDSGPALLSSTSSISFAICSNHMFGLSFGPLAFFIQNYNQ